MSRDDYVVAKGEPLAAAHARIDALLDEIHREKPLTYSTSLVITGFDAGQAMLTLADKERSETAAAALIRYTAQSRNYRGGIYSPGEYTVNDYRVVVSRVAQALLRTKMKFEEALLVRLFSEVADYAGDNARTYPVKSLLGQIDHFLKQHGAFPDGLRAPLQVLIDRVEADAARYPVNGKPPAILKEVADRVRALLGPVRKPKTTKPPKK